MECGTGEEEFGSIDDVIDRIGVRWVVSSFSDEESLADLSLDVDW